MSRKPVNVMEEEEVEEEEVYGDDRFGGGDGGGFADESYEHDEPLEGILQEEDYNLGEVDDEAEEVEEEEEEEEEDIYGTREPSPPVKQRKGRPKLAQKPAKNAPSTQRTKSSSTQPAPKRTRTISTALRSPKIIQRKEIPHPADVSMMDRESTPLILY